MQPTPESSNTAGTAEHGDSDRLSDLVFKALADGHRRGILDILHERGPFSVGELATELNVSRFAITKHAKPLCAAGLVAATRDGRKKLFVLNRASLCSAVAWLEKYLPTRPN